MLRSVCSIHVEPSRSQSACVLLPSLVLAIAFCCPPVAFAAESKRAPAKPHLATIGTDSCHDEVDGTRKHTSGSALDMCPAQRSLVSPDLGFPMASCACTCSRRQASLQTALPNHKATRLSGDGGQTGEQVEVRRYRCSACAPSASTVKPKLRVHIIQGGGQTYLVEVLTVFPNPRSAHAGGIIHDRVISFTFALALPSEALPRQACICERRHPRDFL